MSKRVPIPISSRFGRWTVSGEAVTIKSRLHYPCTCECGSSRTIASTQLRFGKSLSCGCLQRDLVTKHGAAKRRDKTSEYGTWLQMHDRCRNANNPHYRNYGARGINVCERWQKFENFLTDMGPRPEGCSLDRTNNDGNYEPLNCRWASTNAQIRNRRNTRNITANGITKCLNDWAKDLGVSISRLQYRYERGMTGEEIVSLENRRTKRRRTRSLPDRLQ